MRLLYGTTTDVVVVITNSYFGSRFRLYFADHINASVNPPSSNPLRILKDYEDIFSTNDQKNPKFIAHRRGIRQAIRGLITDRGTRQGAMATVTRMGVHAIRPHLAILEVDTYLANHYDPMISEIEAFQLLPHEAASPTSVEYLVPHIAGPTLTDAELHLQPFF